MSHRNLDYLHRNRIIYRSYPTRDKPTKKYWWGSYYEDNNNYELETMRSKEQFVSQHFEAISPNLVWDLGANTGNFSRICSSKSRLSREAVRAVGA